jgi:hypothetical protein
MLSVWDVEPEPATMPTASMMAQVLLLKSLLLALAALAGWGVWRWVCRGGAGWLAAAVAAAVSLQLAASSWGTTFRLHLPAQGACANNLARLAAAMDQWALETRHSSGAPVRFEDIAPYLGPGTAPAPAPPCPNGGRYTLRQVGEAPVCSCQVVRLDSKGRRWERTYQRKILILDLVWWRREIDLWRQWRSA